MSPPFPPADDDSAYEPDDGPAAALPLPLPPAGVHTGACARCGAVLVYPAGTPWASVALAVDEHWHACPNSIRATLARVRADADAEDMVASAAPGASSVAPAAGAGPDGKRIVMDEDARRRALEADTWARAVAPNAVVCGGCGRTVCLDRRSKYYPGMWMKHRGKCVEIRRLEALRAEEGGKEGGEVSEDGNFVMMTPEYFTQGVGEEVNPEFATGCLE